MFLFPIFPAIYSQLIRSDISVDPIIFLSWSIVTLAFDVFGCVGFRSRNFKLDFQNLDPYQNFLHIQNISNSGGFFAVKLSKVNE